MNRSNIVASDSDVIAPSVSNKIRIVKISRKIGKERGNSYQKMKRSPDEMHTQTHGSLTENLRRSQDFFLDLTKANVCEHTVKTAPRDDFDHVSLL